MIDIKDIKCIWVISLLILLMTILDAVCLHSWARNYMNDKMKEFTLQAKESKKEISELKLNMQLLRNDVIKHDESIHYGR